MAAKDLYEKDFYKVLGVDKKSTPEEIKKKYRSLARDLHPDKTQGDSALEEKFKAVSEAYDILSDPKKRAEYDEARSLFELVLLIPGAFRKKVIQNGITFKKIGRTSFFATGYS